MASKVVSSLLVVNKGAFVTWDTDSGKTNAALKVSLYGCSYVCV